MDTQRPALPSDVGLSFVPIVAESEASAATTGDAASIEIELAGAVVRITSDVDSEWLAVVLRAVRCSSGAA